MGNKKNFSSNAGSNESTTPNKEFINPFEGISCIDWANRQMVDDAWQSTIDVYIDTDLFDVYKRPKDPEERAEEWQAWLEYVEVMDAEEEAMQQDAFEAAAKDYQEVREYIEETYNI